MVRTRPRAGRGSRGHGELELLLLQPRRELRELRELRVLVALELLHRLRELSQALVALLLERGRALFGRGRGLLCAGR